MNRTSVFIPTFIISLIMLTYLCIFMLSVTYPRMWAMGCASIMYMGCTQMGGGGLVVRQEFVILSSNLKSGKNSLLLD